jgi:PAS domain S-box-containing protein
MNVMKDVVRTTVVQNPRLNALGLLQALGCKNLQMQILVGGLIYTAATVGLMSLVFYLNLLIKAGSDGQLHQTPGQMAASIFFSGVVVLALLGLGVFALSQNIAQSQTVFSQAAPDAGNSTTSESVHSFSPLSAENFAADPEPLQPQYAAESERLKEELRQSQAQFKAIFNSLPQRVFCKDLDGKYTFVNKAFCEGVKAQAANIIGKTDRDLASLGFANQRKDDKKIIETAQALDTIVEEASANGNKLYLQIVKTPTYDDGGKIIGTQGIAWDVTQSKLAEQALLRESDLLNALMDSSSDIIYFKDLESRFIRINTASHFGFDNPADVIGKSDFDFFTREHAQPAYDDEQRIIQTGEPLIGIEEKETWPDKEDTWASTTKTPLYDRNRKIIGTFGITRDITERKRSEESLKRSLADFLKFVSKVSAGDLTLRAKEAEDTLGMVAQSVNKMLDNFSAMLTEVKKHGLSVSSSASQILVAAEEIEAGTQRQTDEITNITSSVEEMAVCMGQISKNAEFSATATRRVLSTAERGNLAVQDTSQAMVRINSAVEQTAEKMRMLGQRSTEISEIIDLIKDIAVQTNLLSLNAAIQAAHAGEAGLGFSVVADEIRKLAEKSAYATKNVSHLIEGIQSETLEALSAMENGMNEVKSGSVLAEQSREALEDISEVVEQSVQLIEEISSASEEQARVTRSLATAMQTISNITMGASASSHQTAQIIHGMVNLSEDLNESLSQFQVQDS